MVYSLRPLSIRALCEAIAIEAGDRAIDKDSIPETYDILHVCSSLVRRSASGENIELAYFTVKEYLVGLNGKTQSHFYEYNVELYHSHLYIAESCLTYICMESFAASSVIDLEALELRREQHALLSYAPRYWAEYAYVTRIDECLMPLMQRLLHPAKDNILIAWVQDLAFERSDANRPYSFSRETSSLASTSPLHYAAILALPNVCQWLTENGCDVNQNSALGTPLHCGIMGDVALWGQDIRDKVVGYNPIEGPSLS